ncbi:MAG: helix-turn-helix transcriptional regulator [Bacilli bacterium]
MVKLNIEELLKRNKRSKYWLCQQMEITSRNINRIIRGNTSSISFKYIEEFCFYLNCSPGDLISIIDDKNIIKNSLF